MKHGAATLFASLVLVCINLGVGTSAGSTSSIEWYTYDQGLELAKEQNKMMMIDFGSEWCSWCHKLDEDTFSNADVIGFAGEFIPIKVDADQNDAIANKFQIEGLPTVVFANPQEEEMYRVVGYKDSDGFVEDMNLALKKSAGIDTSATVPDSANTAPKSEIPGFQAAVTLVVTIVAILLIRRQDA